MAGEWGIYIKTDGEERLFHVVNSRDQAINFFKVAGGDGRTLMERYVGQEWEMVAVNTFRSADGKILATLRPEVGS